MKSHDLAKLLLSNPDLDIYFYNEYSQNEYHTIGDKLLITPSGLFMTRSTDYEYKVVKSPYEQPQLGHMQIFFKDGTITPKLEGYDRRNVMHMDYGVYYQIPHEKNIILLSEKSTEADVEMYKERDPNTTVFTKNDVDYISVLTEYEPSTWHETWEDMTYDEALQCGKDLAKQLYPEKEQLTQEQQDSFVVDYPDSEFQVTITEEVKELIQDIDNITNS